MDRLNQPGQVRCMWFRGNKFMTFSEAFPNLMRPILQKPGRLSSGFRGNRTSQNFAETQIAQQPVRFFVRHLP